MSAQAAGGAPQELASEWMLAKPGHGDAAQDQRRRIIALGDPLEGAGRVAGSCRHKGLRGSLQLRKFGRKRDTEKCPLCGRFAADISQVPQAPALAVATDELRNCWQRSCLELLA